MDFREIAQTRTSKIIEVAFIGRRKESFAPGKKRLRVKTNGSFVKIGFTVDIAPSEFPRTVVEGKVMDGGVVQSAGILVPLKRGVN